MAGTYSLTVTDGNSCSSSAATTAIGTVNTNPTASASSSTSTVCEDATISLTGGASGGSGGGYNFSWTGPDSYSAPNTQNPTVSANATTAMAGTYSLTVTDGNSCSSSAATTAITVDQNPTSSAVGSNIIQCNTSSFTLVQ